MANKIQEFLGKYNRKKNLLILTTIIASIALTSCESMLSGKPLYSLNKNPAPRYTYAKPQPKYTYVKNANANTTPTPTPVNTVVMTKKPVPVQQKPTSSTQNPKIYLASMKSPPVQKTNAIPVSANKADYIPAVEPKNLKPINAKQYKVKKGDTLWKISSIHRCDLNELRKINNIQGNHIEIGEVLQIP